MAMRVENLQGKPSLMLTKEGISKALKASFEIEGKVKRKDGKWIMIIFDVPEKRRLDRNLLRRVIHNLGYKQFQQSVWVCPFDVVDKTEKLLALHALDQYVRTFLIEEIS